ncbi:TRAP transporter substrate-binding protein DctP [Enterovibrio nigricans]|uniref:TRAP-type C4-dicarboxylate transport system, substrate-binding protein n=1 Tax=Enterovibrio nigricans DSM 22720 TaxID=1121868 RepID=A0A1T4V6H9_9GAMM|nr:TRAP transporter substrate-binding protein DctP [Enterovibrio nigricans]PKF50106.1 C4-dicarboxylate ABC transporter [Enterovibrio nigricans]SKA60575.1 TRAP-type C4-dicarboxylate transport system, substrate-binding protein [Enterovibrio nigricans DSM 22720]
MSSTRRNTFTVFGILLVVLWANRLIANEEETKIWRFGLEEIEGSVQDVYAQEFKRTIETKSNGAITIDIYSYGTLGESEDLTALTANGTLQMTNASTGILGDLIPEIQVFTIPYLFSMDDRINQRVLHDTKVIYEIIGDALIDNNLRLMTLYLEGEMVWSTNKLIRHPRDFRGFKMRVMNAPLIRQTYTLFGAEPVPLPYSQIYGALQSSIIDGQVNPLFAIEEMKFYEVTDYLIWAGQQRFTTSVLANQAWYLSLTKHEKEILRDTFSEMSEFIYQHQTTLNAAQLKKIKYYKPDMILVHLTQRERSRFKKLAAPVRRTYIEESGENGKRLLMSLEKAFSAQK